MDVLVLFASTFRRWTNPLKISLAIITPLLIALIAVLVVGLPSDLSGFLAYPGVPGGASAGVAILAALVFNAIGEEAGWRGYLLPRLMPLGRFRATLIVAVVWAFWHFPLFFLPFGLGAQVTGASVVGWVIGIAAGAFVLSWVWIESGRALGAVILWHLAFNLSSATAATSGTVAAIVSTVVMMFGIVLAIAWVRIGNRASRQAG